MQDNKYILIVFIVLCQVDIKFINIRTSSLLYKYCNFEIFQFQSIVKKKCFVQISYFIAKLQISFDLL